MRMYAVVASAKIRCATVMIGAAQKIVSQPMYSAYYGYGDRHNTVASIVRAKAPGDRAHLSSLGSLLRAIGPNAPAFIVAASGGGTRAAVYTAAVLEGLRNLHLGHRIVLVSGVSGGGVAAAYFYAHRAALLAQDSAAAADGSSSRSAWLRPSSAMLSRGRASGAC